jgi:hypothetical protein
MYAYAILNENNACFTVYETDTERDDFRDRVISLDSYDTKYLDARWVDETNDWEFPPESGYIWNGTEWQSKSGLEFPES